MAVKTITIDMEAYEILAKLKKGNESFSQVIKKTLKDRSNTARRLYDNLDKVLLSEETLHNVENVINDRSLSIAESPILDEE